jgi:hypothetical protein
VRVLGFANVADADDLLEVVCASALLEAKGTKDFALTLLHVLDRGRDHSPELTSKSTCSFGSDQNCR